MWEHILVCRGPIQNSNERILRILIDAEMRAGSSPFRDVFLQRCVPSAISTGALDLLPLHCQRPVDSDME